jgi:hypothetical protein
VLLILVFSGASCSSLAARFKETEQTTESQETKETRTTKQNKQTKEILKTVWFLLPRGGLSIYIYIYIYIQESARMAPFFSLGTLHKATTRNEGGGGEGEVAGTGGWAGRVGGTGGWGGWAGGGHQGPARGPKSGRNSSLPLRVPQCPWSSMVPLQTPPWGVHG